MTILTVMNIYFGKSYYNFPAGFGSIIKWAIDIYKSTISKVSKTYSIVDCNIVKIWCLCGRR